MVRCSVIDVIKLLFLVNLDVLFQGGSTKYHLSSRWLQGFNSDRDRRDLVSIYTHEIVFLSVFWFIHFLFISKKMWFRMVFKLL